MARYLVFARMAYDEPLGYQGLLEVEEQHAQARAAEDFGDQWLELVLVPESEVHWVQRPEEETQLEATA